MTSIGSRWSLLGGWLLLKEYAKLSKICVTASSFVDATGVSERNISIFLKSIISNSFPLNYFGDTIPTTTTMGNEFQRSVFCISFKQKQGTLKKSFKKI